MGVGPHQLPDLRPDLEENMLPAPSAVGANSSRLFLQHTAFIQKHDQHLFNLKLALGVCCSRFLDLEESKISSDYMGPDLRKNAQVCIYICVYARARVCVPHSSLDLERIQASWRGSRSIPSPTSGGWRCRLPRPWRRGTWSGGWRRRPRWRWQRQRWRGRARPGA